MTYRTSSPHGITGIDYGRPLAQRSIPRELDKLTLRLFREGNDTLALAGRLGVHESQVCIALNRARAAERSAF